MVGVPRHIPMLRNPLQATVVGQMYIGPSDFPRRDTPASTGQFQVHGGANGEESDVVGASGAELASQKVLRRPHGALRCPAYSSFLSVPPEALPRNTNAVHLDEPCGPVGQAGRRDRDGRYGSGGRHGAGV
ncbi:hypothetical protein [Streptomyces sp. Wh19]|nr:hypothetical protein [Streptomyces sp. Wh19]MDV9198770.1 hypothetical protein [Streptomyces sp. Wh19]